MPALIYIVYDDVRNTVFDSQVLEPLKKRAKLHPYTRVIIISCQKTAPPALWYQERDWGPVELIIVPRTPFLGTIVLWITAYRVKKILNSLQSSYVLIARCPLAGVTARYAYNPALCIQFIQQARGLLYEEYLAIHARVDWRGRALKKVEQKAYSPPPYPHAWEIESITPALSHYLIENYSAQPHTITHAHIDIPTPIDIQQKITWRKKIRAQLNITQQTCVYIINGSFQAWQTPAHAVALIKAHQKRNSIAPELCHILCLTPNPLPIQNYFLHHCPEIPYTVLHVPNNNIYCYLAAGDYGVVAREPGIVSWISRPVKALEYTAVHLPIIHNNTVQWLNIE